METRKRQGKEILSRFNHVGSVVKDLEKTVEFYSSVFGIGPFQTFEIDLEQATLHGKPTSAKLKIAVSEAKTVRFELIQVLEGETIHVEFLRKGMEGLHHFAYDVDDLDKVLAELAKEGIRPIFSGSVHNVKFAYVNSNSIGGVIIELIQGLK